MEKAEYEINIARAELVDQIAPVGAYSEIERYRIHWRIMEIAEMYHKMKKGKNRVTIVDGKILNEDDILHSNEAPSAWGYTITNTNEQQP